MIRFSVEDFNDDFENFKSYIEKYEDGDYSASVEIKGEISRTGNPEFICVILKINNHKFSEIVFEANCAVKREEYGAKKEVQYVKVPEQREYSKSETELYEYILQGY